jgi:hypothetical protein
MKSDRKKKKKNSYLFIYLIYTNDDCKKQYT